MSVRAVQKTESDAIIERFYTLFTCPRTDWKSAAVQPLFGPSNKRV